MEFNVRKAERVLERLEAELVDAAPLGLALQRTRRRAG